LPTDPRASPGPPALTQRAALLRLATIGIIILIVVGCFAYVGGWLSPSRLTPVRFTDKFEQVFGAHPGFRRNHAKGVCIAGYFDANGRAVRLSRAVVFAAGRVAVSGRFSLAGGEPYASDRPGAVRGMALRFRLSDGEEWRMAMIDLPVFTVGTERAFYDQLAASQPDPVTGQPDRAKVQAFLAAHPETARAMGIIRSQPFSSGFANAAFNSLDAFRFVSSAGVSTPVRWSMMSVERFQPEPTAAPAPQDKNYLFDAVISAIEHGPLRWHLILTIGQPGDPTKDATIPWPASREQVDAGVLTIDHIEAEMPGNCRDINFDPLVLPSGIMPSDDPLLSPRSAIYSQSFTRRAGEQKAPSAVKVPDTGNGP
jgi:catalase